MADEHLEPRAVFPTGMLVGGLAISVLVVIVLSVFVFVMGGHGPTTQAAGTPSATQQKH